MSFMVADSPAPTRRAAAAELERPTPTAPPVGRGFARPEHPPGVTLASYLVELHD